MQNMTEALILILFPMCIVYFVWRFIDVSGKKSKKLAEKFPFIVKHKYAIQIGGVFGFVVVFGIICIVAHLPKEVFYVVAGVVVGLVNSFSASLMYSDRNK